MRENRPYGSEGGEAKAFPTPIRSRLHSPWTSELSEPATPEQAHGTIVDPCRIQRTATGVAPLCKDKARELNEQPNRRDRRSARPARDHNRMRSEQVQNPLGSLFIWIALKGCIHPPQRLPQRLAPSLLGHRPPRKILHQTVHDKSPRRAVLAGRARNQRVVVEAGARLARVIVQRLTWNRDVQQRVGDRIGGEKLSGVSISTEVAQVMARPTSCS